MAWLADEADEHLRWRLPTGSTARAMEAYLRSDVFIAVAADPDLVGITSRDFDALERPESDHLAPVGQRVDVIDRERRLAR